MISAWFRFLNVACCVVAVGWAPSLSALSPVSLVQQVGEAATVDKVAPFSIGNVVSAASKHLADPSDGGKILAGFELYKTNCAQCHGRNLQGQPLWHLQDEFAHRRAPAHDDTGHTWQHSDEDLFQIIRTGRFSENLDKGVSHMPAFDARLNDEEILQVISFIKSRWSMAMKVSQASLNPDFAGMPAGAALEDWTLPLNCVTSSPNVQPVVPPLTSLQSGKLK